MAVKDKFFERACAMWKKDTAVLAKLPGLVRREEYRALVEAVLNCTGRVATMGMGTSGVAARKIAHMLCVANIPSCFVSPGDAAHGAFGSVQKGDLLIMLSRGGATEELVNLIDPIKGKGVTLVTVTRDSGSPLAKASDLVLHLDTDESDRRGVLPTASILAILAIFDAVADELTGYSQFTKKAFYLNHNHGAVGAWLKEDLDDGQEVS